MKINFKKFLNLKIKTAGSVKEISCPDSSLRDWKIIVLIFSVCFVLLSIFSWQIYLSDKIGGGYLVPEEDNTTVVVKMIDKNRLTQNLSFLRARQDEYQKTKINKSRLIDPSL